jgi:hypothetical protein
MPSSAIRQVPDHQEIYLDTNGYTNVIFEVNERVAAEDASNDDEAIKYHLNDIVATETDTIKVWDQGTASLSKLPYVKHIMRHFLKLNLTNPNLAQKQNGTASSRNRHASEGRP